METEATKGSEPAAPLGVGSTEGLGLVPERAELAAAVDTSGSVVLINAKGDIMFYAADGKMQVHRIGDECDACLNTNLRLAEGVAEAWNEKLQRDAAPVPKRCTGVGA